MQLGSAARALLLMKEPVSRLGVRQAAHRKKERHRRENRVASKPTSGLVLVADQLRVAGNKKDKVERGMGISDEATNLGSLM